MTMARTVPEDPFCGITDPAEIAREWPSLDMLDPEEPSAEVLIERAREAEEAALAVAGITNSEGAEAGWGRSSVAPAASNGFAGSYSGSSQGISASVIAGKGTGMERDAARGTASPPSPAATNVWIEKGALSPKALIADIASGFYVTEMMGMGVNGVTGDYSHGAAGFWIENGEIAFPVSEMTVAGNLKDIFARLQAADDLEFKTGADAPTLRIDDLTVAGA